LPAILSIHRAAFPDVSVADLTAALLSDPRPTSIRSLPALSGVSIVFVLGHPGYCRRVGFRPAGELGFAAPYPIPAKDDKLLAIRILAVMVVVPATCLFVYWAPFSLVPLIEHHRVLGLGPFRSQSLALDGG